MLVASCVLAGRGRGSCRRMHGLGGHAPRACKQSELVEARTHFPVHDLHLVNWSPPCSRKSQIKSIKSSALLVTFLASRKVTQSDPEPVWPSPGTLGPYTAPYRPLLSAPGSQLTASPFFSRLREGFKGCGLNKWYTAATTPSWLYVRIQSRALESKCVYYRYTVVGSKICYRANPQT